MVEEVETRPVPGNIHAQWVEGLRRLDQDAWDVLLSHHAADLRYDIAISLRKRGMSEELVDEIEQETWLTAVRKMAEFAWEDEEKFYRWLRAISLNHIYTYRRMLGRTASIEDLPEAEIEDDLERFLATWGAVSNLDGIEQELVLREQLSALDRAMRPLKDQEREILMQWLMGATPRELALTYKMKPRSISMLLVRAKDKIRANLFYFQSLQNKDHYND